MQSRLRAAFLLAVPHEVSALRELRLGVKIIQTDHEGEHAASRQLLDHQNGQLAGVDQTRLISRLGGSVKL
jgi:hypothetical protein